MTTEPLSEWQRLVDTYKSGVSLAFVEASDWMRAEDGVRRVGHNEGYVVLGWQPGWAAMHYFGAKQPKGWNVVSGVTFNHVGDEAVVSMLKALTTVDWTQEPMPVWIMLEGLDHYWKQPSVVFALLNLHETLVTKSAPVIVMVLVSDAGKLPVELAHTGPVIRVPRPSKTEALGLLKNLVKKNANIIQTELTDVEWGEMADAVAGLTAWEIKRAGALSLHTLKRLDVEFLSRVKSEALSQSGVLELVPVTDSLDDIGGLDVLKRWALVRRRAFTNEANTYGLPTPKGVLALGPPGTGKSLFAKALSAAWKFPLLRLDFGRIFGPYVGQSEAQLRDALAQAEAHAPVVLWIDEIEKGMAGSTGPSGDSGTARRILGSFLTWMQEKTAPVFIVATANDVSGLPAEFLRKGRFDEIFFIDLPSSQEREVIWRLHLNKRNIQLDSVPITEFVAATEGFTGAEIEQTIIDALYQAFSDDRPPQPNDWMDAIHDARPISHVMAEKIQELRDWAKERARPSSSMEGF